MQPLLFILLLLTASTSIVISMAIPVNPRKALQFFETVGKLKTLKRSGWVNNEVHLPESVADHMYRMSMLSFLITDATVSKDLILKICMVHDLAESIVGDITPFDGVSKEEKKRLEETALAKIVGDIGNEDIAREIASLWHEYEEGESKEAALARELDKLEMIIQADEYEVAQGKRLDRFFETTKDSFTHPEILSWAEELRANRAERLKLAAGDAPAPATDATNSEPDSKRCKSESTA